jgi:glycosyltransferase involved in cell wall biosynthesis
MPGTHYLPIRGAPLAADRLLAPLTRSNRLLQTARTVAPHLRGGDVPDVLYVEIAYPHGAGVDLARSLSGAMIPLVLKPTGEDVISVPEAGYGFRRFAVPRMLLRRTLGRSAGVRCISPIVVDAVRSMTTAPCPVIPSGVSAETVRAARSTGPQRTADRAACRRRLLAEFGLDDTPLIVALGRLHPFKGLDLLVDALPRLPEAHLLLIGPSLSVKGFGDTGAALGARAREHGVAERVHLTGPVPHERVIDVLGAADVVAVPSLLESMNKVTIEAVAAGAPVVVTRTTGISTFIHEPGVGQVIEPRSVDAVVDAVTAVLAGRWQPDQDAGRRFVERFAPEVVAGELSELLHQAAGKAGRG